jgi:hypothetical protein
MHVVRRRPRRGRGRARRCDCCCMPAVRHRELQPNCGCDWRVRAVSQWLLCCRHWDARVHAVLRGSVLLWGRCAFERELHPLPRCLLRVNGGLIQLLAVSAALGERERGRHGVCPVRCGHSGGRLRQRLRPRSVLAGGCRVPAMSIGALEPPAPDARCVLPVLHVRVAIPRDAQRRRHHVALTSGGVRVQLRRRRGDACL